MSAPRKYVVGDRVVRREGNQLGAEVGEVIAVESDPYPYRVMFGYSEWIMSGLNLALAPEVAPSRKAKADGDFATVEEHIAAWKAGGRRWAKVEGFNVDAWQAERDALARADAVATVMAADPVMAARCGVPAVIGEATACEDLAAAYCATVEASRASGLVEALKPAVMAYTANRTDRAACPTCGAVKGER